MDKALGSYPSNSCRFESCQGRHLSVLHFFSLTQQQHLRVSSLGRARPMTTTALCLNADYRPFRVIPWIKALCLILDGKADLVEAYEGKLLRSPSTSMPWPAVVRLRRYVKSFTRVRLSRRNILARDDYTCQYCRKKPLYRGRPHVEILTVDHVIPRAQAVGTRVYLPWLKRKVPVTCWENVATACGGPGGCNALKGSRTPSQAGMKLLRYPKKPSSVDILRMSVTSRTTPGEWVPYLPEDPRWRGC
jgi:5-methylcytosine-specific restriction endonuclease McrA